MKINRIPYIRSTYRRGGAFMNTQEAWDKHEETRSHWDEHDEAGYQEDMAVTRTLYEEGRNLSHGDPMEIEDSYGEIRRTELMKGAMETDTPQLMDFAAGDNQAQFDRYISNYESLETQSRGDCFFNALALSGILTREEATKLVEAMGPWVEPGGGPLPHTIPTVLDLFIKSRHGSGKEVGMVRFQMSEWDQFTAYCEDNLAQGSVTLLDLPGHETVLARDFYDNYMLLDGQRSVQQITRGEEAIKAYIHRQCSVWGHYYFQLYTVKHTR